MRCLQYKVTSYLSLASRHRQSFTIFKYNNQWLDLLRRYTATTEVNFRNTHKVLFEGGNTHTPQKNCNNNEKMIASVALYSDVEAEN